MPEDTDSSAMVSAARKNGQAHQTMDRSAVAVPEADRAAALLAGVAEATRLLLEVADFDAAVNGALEAIATSAGIDRIYIFQNCFDSTIRIALI
ncbi:MAG: hypothetical protein AAGJ95_16070, partial [Cyanobacteria bacterium J06554_11]